MKTSIWLKRFTFDLHNSPQKEQRFSGLRSKFAIAIVKLCVSPSSTSAFGPRRLPLTGNRWASTQHRLDRRMSWRWQWNGKCYRVSEKYLLSSILDYPWVCSMAMMRTLQMCELTEENVLQMSSECPWCFKTFSVQTNWDLYKAHLNRCQLRAHLRWHPWRQQRDQGSAFANHS